MSGFSAVDTSADPARLVRFLDQTATAESGMKHYVGAAHALRRPVAPILDVGCGAGHDLIVLAGFGLASVGVDPSARMLEAAKPRSATVGAPLVRAVGESLPFGDGVFAGCRIERVLMHVTDPARVLAEVLRCVHGGGLVTVFEPNWTSFRVTSDVLPHDASWITSVRQPDIGGRLWELMEEAGCEILDQVEERSVWRSLETPQQMADLPGAVDRAVAAGRLDGATARRWMLEQRDRHSAGEFHALMPKVLLVAAKGAAPLRSSRPPFS
jgi:SAM-dependent methyltransferase